MTRIAFPPFSKYRLFFSSPESGGMGGGGAGVGVGVGDLGGRVGIVIVVLYTRPGCYSLNFTDNLL